MINTTFANRKFVVAVIISILVAGLILALIGFKSETFLTILIWSIAGLFFLFFILRDKTIRDYGRNTREYFNNHFPGVDSLFSVLFRILVYILFIISIFIIIFGGYHLYERISENGTIFRPSSKEKQKTFKVVLNRKKSITKDDGIEWEVINFEDKGSSWSSGLGKTDGKFLLFTVRVNNKSKESKRISVNNLNRSKVLDKKERGFEVIFMNKKKEKKVGELNYVPIKQRGTGDVEKDPGDVEYEVYFDAIENNATDVNLKPGIPKTFYIAAEVASDSTWDRLKLGYEHKLPELEDF